MLNFSQIFKNNYLSKIFKKNDQNKLNAEEMNISLQSSYQIFASSNHSNALSEKLLKKQVHIIVKNSGKFLTSNQVFDLLSIENKKLKITLYDLELILVELDNKRKIYLFKLPNLEIKLWGSSTLLDKNLIPVESSIGDKECRNMVFNYKYTNRIHN